MMNSIHSYNIIIIIFISFVFGCTDSNKCIESAGSYTTIVKNIAPFSVVRINDDINVVLTKDTSNQIIITGPGHVLKNIQTLNIGNSLSISNLNKCKWLRSYSKPVTVYVPSKSIDVIFNLGYGNVTSSETLLCPNLLIHQYGKGKIDLSLQCASLEIDMNAVGDMTIIGSSEKCNANIYQLQPNAYGVLNLEKLNSPYTIITSNTLSNCFVKVDSILVGTIKNTGNIFYTGKGTLIKEKTGEGNFIMH